MASRVCSIVLICLLIASLSVSAAAASVIRNISPVPGQPGIYEVHLMAGGMQTGGIVEELPAACQFAGTDYPSWRVQVTGQTVAFAVIDDSPIKYRISSNTSDPGGFSGRFEDFLSGDTGMVAGPGDEGADSGDATLPTPAKSPLSAAPAVLALAGVALCFAYAGRGSR